jgi:ABC-type glucose/galactose transport system permease subunit
MFSIGQALRWVGAVIVAAIVYVIVCGIGALVWQKLGGDPLGAMKWILAAATCCAVLTGTFVFPREKWKVAAIVLWVLACLLPLGFLVRNAIFGVFSAVDVAELGGASLGGVFVYVLMRAAAFDRIVNRRSV